MDEKPVQLMKESHRNVQEPPPTFLGNRRASILRGSIIICITILFIVLINIFGNTTVAAMQSKEKFTIDQAGCKIPYLDAFDINIKKFLFPVKPVNCTTSAPNIIKQYQNQLYINSTGYPDLKCSYKSFRRQPPTTKQDDNIVSISYKVKLVNKEYNTIHDEYIRVACRTGKKKFKYFYSFIQKSKVKEKLAKIKVQQKERYVSILVLGVDGVSRLNLHRQMPKTFKYLTKTLEGQEMKGYNKIGENTYPNLMVVLNGLTEAQIETGCLAADQRFNTCPLVWKKYNEKGYITGYAEDSTNVGLFNYNRRGFKNLTTDFDYRVFDQVADDQIGHKKEVDSHLCLGNDLRVKRLVNYIRSFTLTFKSDPYFFFTWEVSISHDYLNNPKLQDHLYYDLLWDLDRKGALEDTAIFFMSDHGIRWGDIRRTYQGFLEERLPFLITYFPKWFRRDYPSAWTNLVANTNRLTTPFDVHKTFVDLANLTSISELQLKQRLILQQRNEGKFKKNPGVSLFLPIPTNRTCKSARIPYKFCACQKTIRHM